MEYITVTQDANRLVNEVRLTCTCGQLNEKCWYRSYISRSELHLVQAHHGAVQVRDTTIYAGGAFIHS